MLIMSMSIFSTPIEFTMWYSIIGTYFLMIVFSCLLKKIININKSEKYIIILIICFFVLYFGYLWFIDFINVKKNDGHPDIFVVSSMDVNDNFSYDTFFYDLYICNIHQYNEERKLVFDLNHDVNQDGINKYCN